MLTYADEAHRLHQYKNIQYRGSFKKSCERIGLTTESDELDWILHQCKCAVLFYDQDQVIGPSGIDVKRFERKIQTEIRQKNRLVSYYRLLSQMRVHGGNGYIAFINEILGGKAKAGRRFDNYEFALVTSFRKFDEMHYEKEKAFSLSRMAAEYAWQWASKEDKSKIDIVIEGVSKQ